MRILTNQEIDLEFGTESFWNPRRLGVDGVIGVVPSLKYVGGIECFDEIIQTQNILDNATSSMYLTQRGFIITAWIGRSTYKTGIHLEDINYWTIEAQKEILAKKDKSIIGRAILGGLLLWPLMGPAGAIVAGMTGLGKKDIKLNSIDNIIACSCKEKNEKENEIIVFFSCNNKDIKHVIKFIEDNFQHKYKKSSDIPIVSTKSTQPSIADELMKFKTLLDEGLLTKEEFEKQKIKLLN
jgi:hypothetical protein